MYVCVLNMKHIPLIDWRFISNTDLSLAFGARCKFAAAKFVKLTKHNAIAHSYRLNSTKWKYASRFQIASNIFNERRIPTRPNSVTTSQRVQAQVNIEFIRLHVVVVVLTLYTLWVILTTIITANIFFYSNSNSDHVKMNCILQSTMTSTKMKFLRILLN